MGYDINLALDRLSLRSLWHIQGKIWMYTESRSPEKVLPGDANLEASSDDKNCESE